MSFQISEGSNYWCCGECHPWFCIDCDTYHCNWFSERCPVTKERNEDRKHEAKLVKVEGTWGSG